MKHPCKEQFFDDGGGETLAQVAQRTGDCPIPGNIQGQLGQGSEQHFLVENMAEGLDLMIFKGPTQTPDEANYREKNEQSVSQNWHL